MNCQPERVTAYVDGELGVDARAELDAHLRTCTACSDQVAAERRLRERLLALPHVELPAGLEQRVRGELRARSRRNPGAWVRVALPLAAGLVLALLWARGNAALLTWQVARDHAHCYGLSRLPAEVFASRIEPVAAWFGAHDQALPALPSSSAGLEIVGGRFCRLLDGRRSAHLYYASGERHLSVFVVPDGARFDRRHAGAALGLHVRLRRLAGHTVAVVSDDQTTVDTFARSFETAVARFSPPPLG